MTDRELIELAAKAAAIDGKWSDDFGKSGMFMLYNPTTYRLGFDPLTNDGDALRLAVKLGLVVFIMNNPGFTGVYLPNCAATGKYDEVQMHKNDPAYATRRAITMAAAQIGETMA